MSSRNVYLQFFRSLSLFYYKYTVDLPKEEVILLYGSIIPVGEEKIMLTEEVYEGEVAVIKNKKGFICQK